MIVLFNCLNMNSIILSIDNVFYIYVMNNEF